MQGVMALSPEWILTEYFHSQSIKAESDAVTLKSLCQCCSFHQQRTALGWRKGEKEEDPVFHVIVLKVTTQCANIAAQMGFSNHHITECACSSKNHYFYESCTFKNISNNFFNCTDIKTRSTLIMDIFYLRLVLNLDLDKNIFYTFSGRKGYTNVQHLDFGYFLKQDKYVCAL